MAVPNPSLAFALFDGKDQADAALAKLREAGFGEDQIELTGRGEGPSQGQDRGVFSPIRTLLLGGDDAGAQLYDHLVELGIDPDEAQYFREEVDQDKLLVTVISMRREREAADILRQQGGRGAFEPEPSIRQEVAAVAASPDHVEA